MTPPISTSTARPAVPANAQSPSFAEERREVFESVLASLARDPLDADQWAAGGRLLRHLSRTAAPLPWLVRGDGPARV